MEMKNWRHFVVFKSENRYSITECSNSGVRHAFMCEGVVSGDGSVLQGLLLIMPADETLRSFVEKEAGQLIFCDP